MSLSAILSNLSKAFSGAFWLAGVFPSAVFWILNAAMFYWINRDFRRNADAIWEESHKVGTAAFVSAFFAIIVLLFAYSIFASVSRLRKLLEGDWPELFGIGRAAKKNFIAIQSQRWSQFEQRGLKAKAGRVLESDLKGWQNLLLEARSVGTRLYPGKCWSASSPDALAPLRKRRDQNDLLPYETLETAVHRVRLLLLNWDGDASPALDRLQEELLLLMIYAKARAEDEHFLFANQRFLDFGSPTLSATDMGNIASSVQAYAIGRYNFNLEVFWSSLQRCVQKDKEFFPVLEEAKTRLDFLVACCWLTGFFTLAWVVGLALLGYQILPFLSLALAGPLLTYAWYRVALEQYRAFADALKTTVDLFRMDLLKSLHLKLPTDVEEERAVWHDLNGLVAYREDGNFRYQHPPA